MTEQSSYFLRNLTLRTATALELSATRGYNVHESIGDRAVGPGEAVQIHVLVFYEQDSRPLVVEWTERVLGRTRRRVWRDQLPAPVAPKPY
jgi:hypothetical protein